MITEKALIEQAEQLGFSAAAMMKVRDLTIVSAYREYCAENLCGQYDKNPACPPKSGTVEEMTARLHHFSHALILQTEVQPQDRYDIHEQQAAKRAHNVKTEQLMTAMQNAGAGTLLMMGAGPWKTHSCMSAYCVDAQRMADAVGMKCWANDGSLRYFSLLLIP